MDFVKVNLRGQTPLRVDGNWASQNLLIGSMAQTVPPNYVLCETELDAMLPVIASAQGLPQNTLTPYADHAVELAFSNVYDGELEAKARAI